MNFKNIKKLLYDCFHNPASPRSRNINGIITLFIIISISVIPLHFVARINSMMWIEEPLFLFDKIIVTIFTIEYFLRIWSSKNPRNFIFSWEGIIDFVSILPFYLNKFALLGETPFSFETFLLLRILRVLRFTTMYGIEEEALDRCKKNKKFYRIPGEKVEHVIQKHPIVFIAGMVLPLVFTSVSLMFLIWAKSYDWNAWMIALAILFGSMTGLFFIKAWLDYNYDVIYITTHRIILQNHELFGSKTNALGYDAITNIVPNNRGFWRWALGMGHVEIETANRYGTIRFQSVRHPHKVVSHISNNRTKAREHKIIAEKKVRENLPISKEEEGYI